MFEILASKNSLDMIKYGVTDALDSSRESAVIDHLENRHQMNILCKILYMGITKAP